MTAVDTLEATPVGCSANANQPDGKWTMPRSLPPAAQLIDGARAAMAQAAEDPKNQGLTPAALKKAKRAAANAWLDDFAPAVDAEVDGGHAGIFMGFSAEKAAERTEQEQLRAASAVVSALKIRRHWDGSPYWPPADRRFGRSDVWKLRTIILHYAEAPGRGHKGQPRQGGRMVKKPRRKP